MEKVPMLAEGYEQITAELKVLRAERPKVVDDIDAFSGATLRDAALASLINTAGGLFGIGGSNSDQLFGAIITAVKSDTSSNLLSTPSILTLDNQQARILVGGNRRSDHLGSPGRTVARALCIDSMPTF